MNNNKQIAPIENLQDKIFTIRSVQVMLDSDLAKIYGVETKIFNRAVKRNSERFPESFRFQLTKNEYENLRFHFGPSSTGESLRCQNGTLKDSCKDSLRSQSVTLNTGGGRGQHRKYLPYVFTEQGVSMLSAVLRSETAILVSIKIINAFVEMRRFIQDNAQVFARLDFVERRQIGFESETEKNFEKVFQALQSGEPPKQGIFFNGQIFDAYVFAADLVRGAKKSIKLIDNYVDDTVLTLFGASLKDLGKKWFAFSKMDSMVADVLKRLEGSEYA